MTDSTLTIATRQSPMALHQAKTIQQQLQQQYPNINIILLPLSTKGDQKQEIAFHEIGGSNIFIKELQHSLLNKTSDIAVHCLKDISVFPTDHLTIAAVCKREDPRDAFISNHASCLLTLPPNSVIGTSSPRRAAFIQQVKPDCRIKLSRGNVNTRLKKLDDGEYDAIILAAAGLKRLNLEERITEYLSPDIMLPAIGQGTIAIECRSDDSNTISLIKHLNDPITELCITAERAVNRKLNGGCQSAIAALATIENQVLSLKAWVGSTNSSHYCYAEHTDNPLSAEALGSYVADQLLEQGAEALLSNANPLH